LKKPFDHLTICDRRKSIKEEADFEYRKNAKRMKLQYAKKKRQQIATYKAGDPVTLRIPRSERSKTDMTRLLCYMLKVSHGLHRLQ